MTMRESSIPPIVSAFDSITMAARNRNWTPEVVRQKIRTSMLINHLQNHVVGKIQMSKTQVAAAGLLLKKTLPDMVSKTTEPKPFEGMTVAELQAKLDEVRGYLASAALGGAAIESDSEGAGGKPLN
jgi:hypothetical protein